MLKFTLKINNPIVAKHVSSHNYIHFEIHLWEMKIQKYFFELPIVLHVAKWTKDTIRMVTNNNSHTEIQ